jgi:protein-arginine kinase activator protein McsA
MTPCERCGQPASLRVAEAGVERWCCNACADALTAVRGLADLAQSLKRPARRDGKCPNCGTKETDARTSGLVGCPLCYSAFSEGFWTEIGVPKASWSRSDLW